MIKINYAKKKDDKAVYESLYHYLLNNVQYLIDQEGKTIHSFINEFKLRGREILKYMILPEIDFEKKIVDYRKPTFNLLNYLADLAFEMLVKLVKPGKTPTLEIISPIGEALPMSLLIQIKPETKPTKVTLIHYNLIAQIIEEWLYLITNNNLFFNIKIFEDMGDKKYFFEIGFTQNYYQDFFIIENNSKDKSDRPLLDQIKNFFISITPLDFFEYEDENGKLHYKLTFKNNRDLEETYSIIIQTKNKVVSIGKKLLSEGKVETIREWKGIENWDGNCYAIIGVKTNIGYLMEKMIIASNRVHKFGKFLVHYERIDGGWKINTNQKVDFDMLFTPLSNLDLWEKIYKKITRNPDELIRLRYQALIVQKEEIAQRRIEVCKDRN